MTSLIHLVSLGPCLLIENQGQQVAPAGSLWSEPLSAARLFFPPPLRGVGWEREKSSQVTDSKSAEKQGGGILTADPAVILFHF